MVYRRGCPDCQIQRYTWKGWGVMALALIAGVIAVVVIAVVVVVAAVSAVTAAVKDTLDDDV